MLRLFDARRPGSTPKRGRVDNLAHNEPEMGKPLTVAKSVEIEQTLIWVVNFSSLQSRIEALDELDAYFGEAAAEEWVAELWREPLSPCKGDSHEAGGSRYGNLPVDPQ